MPDTYTIACRVPEVQEFQLLRATLGYDELDDSIVERALDNTLFGVCAERDQLLIGCARVVGDGGLYFFIEDIMVLPGIGSESEVTSLIRCMMDEIMQYLRQSAPPTAFFCIKDASAVEKPCRRFGFGVPRQDDMEF